MQVLSAFLASHFHYKLTLTARNIVPTPLCLPGELDPLCQKQVSLAHSPSSRPLHPPAPPPPSHTHEEVYVNSTFLQSGCQKAYELFIGPPSCHSAHTNEHPVTTEASNLLYGVTSEQIILYLSRLVILA